LKIGVTKTCISSYSNDKENNSKVHKFFFKNIPKNITMKTINKEQLNYGAIINTKNLNLKFKKGNFFRDFN